MSTGQKKMPAGQKMTSATAMQGAEGMVSQYPLASVLVAFGIGLGVGVALETILAEPLKSQPSFGQRTEIAAEKLGRQMLDAIAGVLPESLSKHISCA